MTRYITEGDFTLVVSAFSTTHLGEFSLLVSSSRWIEVDPIPQEGAGMFAKTMRGEWCVLHFTIFGGMTEPVLMVKDQWCSSALFPRVANTHGCQVSPHSNHSHFVPITFSRCYFVCRPLLILSGHHLQNSLAAPGTCVRACRAVSLSRWDSGCLFWGFHRRTVRDCDCTGRTARRAVYYRARGGWTSY